MNAPRLRMVAGPNGSGKTTLFRHLQEEYSFSVGFWLNPDEVDRALSESRRFDFTKWGLNVKGESLLRFLRNHPLSFDGSGDLAAAVSVEENVLILTEAPRATPYLAATVCDFMRREWLEIGSSFTFETVMSSRDKVDLLREARTKNYRTYLYYICTESPLINRARVASRVLEGGHDVPADKIVPRYERSLSLLSEAISLGSRAYIFDNSGKSHRFVAEFEDGRFVRAAANLPAWVVRWVLGQ